MRRRFLALTMLIALVLLCLLQESLCIAIGRPFDLIHLPLFVALFATSVFDERLTLCTLLLFLVIRGLTATDSTVSLLILGIVLFVVLTELHFRFFTNRTLYSVLALGFIGWAIYIAGEYAFQNAWAFIGRGTAATFAVPSASSLIVSAMTLAVFLTVSYASTVIVSKRMRSYFVLSGKH